MSKLTNCPACGHNIAQQRFMSCPKCGGKFEEKGSIDGMMMWFIASGLLFFVFWLVSKITGLEIGPENQIFSIVGMSVVVFGGMILSAIYSR